MVYGPQSVIYPLVCSSEPKIYSFGESELTQSRPQLWVGVSFHYHIHDRRRISVLQLGQQNIPQPVLELVYPRSNFIPMRLPVAKRLLHQIMLSTCARRFLTHHTSWNQYIWMSSTPRDSNSFCDNYIFIQAGVKYVPLIAPITCG